MTIVFSAVGHASNQAIAANNGASARFALPPLVIEPPVAAAGSGDPNFDYNFRLLESGTYTVTATFQWNDAAAAGAGTRRLYLRAYDEVLFEVQLDTTVDTPGNPAGGTTQSGQIVIVIDDIVHGVGATYSHTAFGNMLGIGTNSTLIIDYEPPPPPGYVDPGPSSVRSYRYW
jgi:hypothetical protein